MTKAVDGNGMTARRIIMYVDIGHEAQDLRLDGIEIGCIMTHTMTLCPQCIRRCRYILIDQGLTAAKRGLTDGELWSWYSRAIKAARAAAPDADIKAIVPDAFHDMEGTLKLWEKWHKRIESWGATPVLVLQEPRKIGQWVKTKAYRDAPAVATPARELGPVKCSERPRLCADVIAVVADVVAGDGKWLHLLGAAFRVLKILRPRFGRDIHSFDTTSYRLAVSNDIRIRKAPDERGLWIAKPGMEKQFLAEWLTRLLEP